MHFWQCCLSSESRSTNHIWYVFCLSRLWQVWPSIQSYKADSSSLLEAPNGRSLIFLFTHDSCFIYRLGCSQHCLSVSAVSSQTLEVTDPLEGISCTDSHHLLAELCKGSELIQRLSDHRSQLRSTSRDAPSGDPASSWSIFTIAVRRPEQRQSTTVAPGPYLVQSKRGAVWVGQSRLHSCCNLSVPKKLLTNAHLTTCLCCLSLGFFFCLVFFNSFDPRLYQNHIQRVKNECPVLFSFSLFYHSSGQQVCAGCPRLSRGRAAMFLSRRWSKVKVFEKLLDSLASC